MELAQKIILGAHFLILGFCLANVVVMIKFHINHKKTMKSFKEIGKIMDLMVAEKITVRQVQFRLIQLKEQMNEDQIESTRINRFIAEAEIVATARDE